MKEENYRCAVECYTKAIDLDLSNAVYYCNRYLQPDHIAKCIFFAHLYFSNAYRPRITRLGYIVYMSISQSINQSNLFIQPFTIAKTQLIR